jgi:hypothetical protein
MRMPAMFLAMILGGSAPCVSYAQDQQPASGGDTEQPATGGDAQQSQLLDTAQLDQLVAPIALYPDTLLAQLLMASTYPLEIVQAARWMEANKNLKGEALEAAAAKQDWDDSVKALVTTPTVITMMNDQLDWTQSLGDAVLAQQADVMDAIQRLRGMAQDNGKLETTEQQTVTTTQQAGKEVIVIEPASPEVVYVPYYEPAVVYGTWPYPSYPPYYYPPAPGWVAGGALVSGLAWSAGFAIGNAIWNDYEPFNWGRNDIRVNVNKNVNINRNDLQLNNWKHDSYHRRGVNYKNQNVRNQFSKTNIGSNKNNRNFDFRGHDGKQVLNVDRPGSKPGNRPDFGGKGQGGKGPDFGGKGQGGKGPGGKGPDFGGKGQGGKGPGGKGPDLGNKRPGGGGGDKQAALQDRKPSKPSAPSKAKRPAPSKGGGAFDMRDGGKAKNYSKRGKASMGNRSPRSMSKPRGGGGGKASKGGGRPGGGGRGRGGGGRRR